MRTPFLLLLLALASGILLSDLFQFHYPIFIGISAILLSLILAYQHFHPHLTQTLILTALLCLLSLNTGVGIRSLQMANKLNAARLIQNQSAIKVVLTEYKGLKGKNELWVGRMGKNITSEEFNIHLYLDTSSSFHKNDILHLSLKDHWEFCTETKNAWMLKSNILAQSFPKHYIKTKESHQPNIIMQYSERLQD